MSDEEVEFHDVEWQVDDDGTQFFVAEGRRYELADDGYAYDVGPADAAAADDAPAQAAAPDADGASSDDRAGPAVPAAGPGDGLATSTDETTELARVDADAVGGNGHDQSDGDTRSIPTASLTREPARATNGHGHGDGHGGDGEPLLKVRGLRSGYGALPVLHGVDLDIHVGQTAVLFGLNGAGKTTTAMNVCGALEVWDGQIEFDGVDLTRAGIKKCVDHGIVMVPEGRRVFPAMSVARNLQVGAWTQRKDEAWVEEQLEVVLGYFPRLGERLQQDAGTLSGGEQQMLAMARGLMARPRLLIIDEASMGLAPVIVSQVFEIIEQINDDGVTVLMIEQNVGALDVADVGIVMEQGTIIRRLRGEELTDRSVISEALMG